MTKLIYGVGINDSDYKISSEAGGKLLICKFYQTWRDMIKRCYSGKNLGRQPSYSGCLVCEDWHSFSSFKRWMESKDWEGKYLDKDILSNGRKLYSPETCAFVCRLTNNFIEDCGVARGKYLIGCYFDKKNQKYKAQCSNPFTKKNENLGRFNSEIDAHRAWRKRKHEIALSLSELQSDERVMIALRTRYAEM